MVAIRISLVLLLAGCVGEYQDPCQHYTNWVESYEACIASEECNLTGAEWHDYRLSQARACKPN